MDETFDDRVARLSQRRQLLLRRLAAERGGPGRIEPRPAGTDRVPLSAAQEQLWFLDTLAPGEPTYNLVQGAWLDGDLDTAALRRALDDVVARHEALRTVFDDRDGIVTQRVRPPAPAELALDDVSDLPPGERRDAALRRLQQEEVHRPFDLRTGPLFRARLVRLAPGEHAFALAAHHSVVDGWSMGVIVRELAEAYAARRAGVAPDLPPPPVQYPDYARWQRDRMRGDGYQAGLAYWQERLAGLPELELPSDRRRPATVSYAGATLEIPLDPETYAGVQSAAKHLDAGPFMIVVAAFTAVLARWSGATDLAIGTAFTGRTRPEVENTVGFFANMGVLRMDASGDPAFATLVDRARTTCVDALSHQDVPFEQVVQRVAPPRDPSRNPLFQVAVQMLGGGTWGGPALPGLDGGQIPLRLDRSRFDVMVSLVDQGDRYTVLVEYSTDLFDAGRIRRMVAHLERLLVAGPARPEDRLSELPLLDERERAEVLAFGAGPRRPVPETTVVDLIEEQARRAPDTPAVRHGDAVLTYRELLERSRGLAAGLAEAGVRPGDRVAVLLDRGLDEISLRLAIWYAAAAHVPLDTSAPPARLSRMIDRAGPAVVVTDETGRDRLPGGTTYVIGALWSAADEPTGPRPGPDDTAFVLHTSGSTGDPKGTPLDHRSLVAYLGWVRDGWDCGPGDRVLHVCAPTFDVGAGEILGALTSGATVVVADRETVLSPGGLAGLLAREDVTHAFLTPTTLSLVDADPAGFPALRHVAVAGEVCPAEMAARWSTGGRRFVNAYGPTEATIAVTAQDCTGWAEAGPPPIGRPMPNRRVYVVDRWDNLAPVGARGEILLGGAGISPGYLGEPELSARRFTADPFDPSARVYRTGDQGSWDPDGRLHYLGRTDALVKLRGMRIELTEIEAVLAAQPGITGAAVTVKSGPGRIQHLVGYLTSENGPADPVALRAALAEQLPPHMIPGHVVTVPALPQTGTGKVDRRALPDVPELTGAGPAGTEAPRNGIEKRVAEIFGDVLGRDGIGRDTSFFDLGGHSLQAAYLLARIARELRAPVPLKQFYAEPTVAAVAATVGRAAATTRPRSPLVPLKPSGGRPTLYCPHAVSGSPYWYLGLSRAVHPEQPLSGFEAPGLEGEETPAEDLKTLADTYVRAMLERQPDGPYLLAGWSMGGFLCFEMARQLDRAGRRPALVLMIDSNEPGPLPLPSEAQVIRTFVADLAGLTGDRPPDVPDAVTGAADPTAALGGFLSRHGLIPADVDPDFIAQRYAVFRANMRAIYAYRPEPYPGPVVMVQAGQEPSRAGWGRYATAMRTVTLPGTHYTIWSPERLPALAAVVDQQVEALPART
jgi:amino acid adenylation domain-containing protein